jgi:hypothetical protein
MICWIRYSEIGTAEVQHSLAHPKLEKRPFQTEKTANDRSLLLLFFDRNLSRGFHHLIHDLFKILQTGGRDNDIVAATINVLSNTQETTTGIFLQGEDESLALDLDFLRFEGVFVDGRLRWAGAVRAITMG